ncbi:MAG: pyridoxamine 5'-phosphate oxidase family protein [Chloroflexi bacterium]|nr:pyridoxamine 5'-phosphate oxidase family protein [Chloroflexota bacterium]
MAIFCEALSKDLQDFIAAQHIFFVATAAANGRINLSPKGMDTLRCLNSKQVMFLNLTGSGNETAAHLAENGRLTIMFCSFEARPLILRLYGNGRVIHPRDAEWNSFIEPFSHLAGSRQFILLDIDSVQTSCGFAVPFYNFQGERDALLRTNAKKGEEKLREYRRKNNQVSIDGLPTYLLAE